MDFTQQLKIPRNQSTTPRQALLVRIAVGGGILTILLLLAGSLFSGKSSQPQMEETLASATQLIEASELINQYQTSEQIKNIATSVQIVAKSHVNNLNRIAIQAYPKFNYKPVVDTANIQESLETAEQSNNVDEQATIILKNSLTLTLGKLQTLSNSTNNANIIEESEAATSSLQTLQAQLSDS